MLLPTKRCIEANTTTKASAITEADAGSNMNKKVGDTKLYTAKKNDDIANATERRMRKKNGETPNSLDSFTFYPEISLEIFN